MPSLATLAPPFVPGFDPRRRRGGNTGKKYSKSTKRIFKELLAEPGGKVSGKDADRKEVMLFLAIKDATDANLDPVDRHRAVNLILDRIDGKPQQSNTLKVSGEVTVGMRVSELNESQRAALRQKIERGELWLLEDGTVQEAEFEDSGNVTQRVTNLAENAESEPESATTD